MVDKTGEEKSVTTVSAKDIEIKTSNKGDSEHAVGCDPPVKEDVNNIVVHSSEETAAMESDADPPIEILNENQFIERESFPDRIDTGRGNFRIPATISNIKYVLKSYGISVGYDVIKKKLVLKVPGQVGCPDNADNSALSYVTSLTALNDIPIGQVRSYLEAIGNSNPINPVADWIMSREWDGKERKQSLSDTLVQSDDFPKKLKEVLIEKWIRSAAAAVLLHSGFRARGVLTLLGAQSLGKTTWVGSLVPDSILRDSVVKLDHHLDAGNKDSLITALSHWIVEVGELDGSFKKDIAKLKGFLTGVQDKLRRPYGSFDSEYQRRTVFCATVNDPNFLVDTTGNTRWWVIPVISVNYEHKIDMQQVFAQAAVDIKNGKEWWLTMDEERWLEEQNKDHRSVSVIRERVLSALDLETRIEPHLLPAMTPSELLIEIGINNPTNPQSRECGGVLREHYGDPKKINGQFKWRVSLKYKPVSSNRLDEHPKYDVQVEDKKLYNDGLD